MDPADDIPMLPVNGFYFRSAVNSLDFHPVNQEVLLVGTRSGGVFVWNGAGKPMVVSRNFQVETGLERFSSTLQDTLVKEYTASVTRAVWSPDGQFFGVAYSKSLLKMFSFCNYKEITFRYEIEAHSGSVNDLAFTYMNKELRLITCGDDKQIKVWDGARGHIMSILCHDEAVYSVLLGRISDSEQFLYATDAGGKILHWTYNCLEAPSKYDAPDIVQGSFCSRMALSSDGKRLFYCGTDCDGTSYLFELDKQVTVKRTYLGIDDFSLAYGISQFDTAMNKYLAFRDNNQVRFWMMDDDELRKSIYAEGNSPSVSPCLRFNSKGTLLAVSSSHDRIIIFANAEGRKHLLSPHGGFVVDFFDPLKAARSANTQPSGLLPAISDNPSQICSLWIPDPEPPFPSKIARLLYIKNGGALMSLSCRGVLKVWSWPADRRNPEGQATVHMPPVLRRPDSGIDMVNTINFRKAVHCLALSPTGDCVASSSGDQMKVFCLTKFEVVSKHLGNHGVVTCLAFDPHDSNQMAIGLENSSILIYQLDNSKSVNILCGHEKRVTGLAFTGTQNFLISSEANNWIHLWNITVSDSPIERMKLPCQKGQPDAESEPRLQFHYDLVQFLVVHESALSIFRVSPLQSVAMTYSDVMITDATYSRDCELVYTCFRNGRVGIFGSQSLQLMCQINLSAYLPLNLSIDAYPTTVAANPDVPGQFAVAISVGGVLVLEPPQQGKQWGESPSPSSEDDECAEEVECVDSDENLSD